VNFTPNSKINQRATVLLLEKIEQLRALPIQEIRAGDFSEQNVPFQINWSIRDNTPYQGTFQIRCRIIHSSARQVIVESIFYRSE
jgi:hypothetical protein